jgi:hypothetical protein
MIPTPIYPPEISPHSGPLRRGMLYVPRFVHHLRRRLRSDMGLRHAWRSTRLRMEDYR